MVVFGFFMPGTNASAEPSRGEGLLAFIVEDDVNTVPGSAPSQITALITSPTGDMVSLKLSRAQTRPPSACVRPAADEGSHEILPH